MREIKVTVKGTDAHIKVVYSTKLMAGDNGVNVTREKSREEFYYDIGEAVTQIAKYHQDVKVNVYAGESK